MNANRSERATPPRSASTVISAKHWTTAPSSRLCAIFTSRATSPSPTYVTDRPSTPREGRAVSKDPRGPDTTRLSIPAFATFGLPLTGAASIGVPISSARRLTRPDTSDETVEQSIKSPGAWGPDNRPDGPSITANRSASPPIIVKTMSRSARSDGASTTVAPRAASGSVFARVRL